MFDEILKGVTNQVLGGEGQQGGLMEQVLGMINDRETGGLSGLIEQFRNSGLGDVVSSWIGTGENQPVSGEQIEQAFGSEKIQEIAQSLGISGSDTSGGLAALLPQIIDRMTPEGTVPEGGLLDQALGMLKQKILA